MNQNTHNKQDYPDALLNNFIEIELVNPQNFIIVKETLTRMGVSPRNKKNLYQSCHIFNANGRRFIVHFKELFLLEGKEASMEETDIFRRNHIAKLLQDWNLIRILHPERFHFEDRFMKLIKIISVNDRDYNQWKLIPKYHIRSIKQHVNTYNH